MTRTHDATNDDLDIDLLGEWYPSGADEVELVDFYLDGHCWYLALAMRDATGWPIHVIGRRTELADGTVDLDFSHAVCLHPTGVLVDVTGPSTVAEAERFWHGDAIAIERDEFVEQCGIEFSELGLANARGRRDGPCQVDAP